jgi:DNA-binding phage protein
LTEKQREFLDVFINSALGNVSVAAKATGIRRETYYKWLQNPIFKATAAEARERRKDFIESALDARIKAGDTAAIIFAAKTVCKDRGYVERSEVMSDNNIHAEVQTLEGLPKETILKIAKLIEPY